MKKIRSYLLNLFHIALSDTDIDPNEVNLLYEIGIEKGLSKSEIDSILSEPHKISFLIPETTEDKFEQLFDMARMIWADRVIKLEEIQTMKLLSLKINVDSVFVEPLIDALIIGVKTNEKKDDLFNKVKKYL